MRRRARHRLMGAAVLVLVGVVGFPLLFDSQPRPIPVDVAINIPDRDKVAPLTLPQPSKAADEVGDKGLAAGEELVAPRTAAPADAKASSPADAKPASPAPSKPQPEVKPPAKAEPARAEAPAPKVEHKAEHKAPEPKPEPKHEVKPEPKLEPKHAVAQDSGARARALLEGRTPAAAQAAAPAAPAAGGRFIVQVGAFADDGKVADVRSRLERLGLKTYTQAVNANGKRTTRVRLGPFNSRADADKAAERAKSAGLAASVLTL